MEYWSREHKFLGDKRKAAGFSRSSDFAKLHSPLALPLHADTNRGARGRRPGLGSPFADRLKGRPRGRPGADSGAADALRADPGPARAGHRRVTAPRRATASTPPPASLGPAAAPVPLSAGRAGHPRASDTHRRARPNRGPDPGCRGRRARLLRTVPALPGAPHPRLARLLCASPRSRAAAFSLLRACSRGSRPPPAPRPAPPRPPAPAGRERARRAQRERARRPLTLPRRRGVEWESQLGEVLLWS
ncbi:Wilms tumor protein 1-interacting protein-like [Marmota monax]|uniref:Wilms tumor protein 1-interacting protein-like n=1 Tax=Marmota monax TaxID=9995 RepID=UPI001EB078A6|nr:Wilms tumor protein 1-interacting protein-like [Marmota monax]